jgi:inner membrane protein
MKAGRRPEMVVANPVPFMPWRRDMLWRGDGRYGDFAFSLLDPAMPASAAAIGKPTGMDDPGVEIARQRNGNARTFLFWSRMPLARREANGDLVLGDQRFQGLAVRGGFAVRVPASDLR